ncbi:hypothetical protein J1605_013607 [Eschrichtius robustus]|uniref:C5orf34-like N-terminal domain-containing protein n=1 Tax=Eschrichtius robustus TaxID=9764 RepID=A0AB34GI67_ESCRO|nr:hypothetical protein J1605_013607 [Eschrichtius robustus]
MPALDELDTAAASKHLEVMFLPLPWKDILSIVTIMAAEVQIVLYEDDSVQVQYVDGSRLQLSPCGSEFLFEKAPPISAHPLQQPERIRQRTHFVISTYREQLQRALDFRNSFATCPFLSESIIPSERKKVIFFKLHF